MFLEHRPTPLRIRRYYANAHKRGQEVPSSSPCPALPRVLSVPTTSRGIGRCRVRVRPSRLHREHHGSSTPATSAATFSIEFRFESPSASLYLSSPPPLESICASRSVERTGHPCSRPVVPSFFRAPSSTGNRGPSNLRISGGMRARFHRVRKLNALL